jgi:hypothetical protein
VLPGRYNSGTLVLIKFDGNRQYSFWDRTNQTWILGTTVFEEHWLNGNLIPVTEEEGKRMIEKEAKSLLKSRNSKQKITR